MKIICQIFLFSLALTISTALNVEGPCRSVSTMKNFDMAKYVGVWYELERYDLPVRENSDCIKSEFELQNGEFHVQDTGYNYWEGVSYTKKATGTQSTSGEAKLKYWFEGCKYSWSYIHS